MELLAKLKLGASQETIENSFRDWVSLPPHPTQRAIGFLGIENEVPIGVVCYFASGFFKFKLARAELTYFPDGASNSLAMATHKELVSILTRLLGSPASVRDTDLQNGPEEFRMTLLHVWVRDDEVTTVALGLAEHRQSQGGSPLNLSIASRKMDSAAEMIASNALRSSKMSDGSRPFAEDSFKAAIPVPGVDKVRVPEVSFFPERTDDEAHQLYLTALSGAANLLVPIVNKRVQGRWPLETVRGCALMCAIEGLNKGRVFENNTRGILAGAISVFEELWSNAGDFETAITNLGRKFK